MNKLPDPKTCKHVYSRSSHCCSKCMQWMPKPKCPHCGRESFSYSTNLCFNAYRGLACEDRR